MTTAVSMPFRASFREAIVTGRKTMTSRGNRYGNVGDFLDTPFGSIKLTEVYRDTLGAIRARDWKDEGCDSPDHFQTIWQGLHRGRFDAMHLVWVHRFEFVG